MPEWSSETAEFLTRLRTEIDGGHPIALFIGSGVSRDWGLPLWEELCSRVLARAFKRASPGTTLEQAAYLAEMYSSLQYDTPLAVMQYAHDLLDERFPETLRNALYEDNKQSIPPAANTLHVLARVINNDHAVRDVVTYNYDDYLERMLGEDFERTLDIVEKAEDLSRTSGARERIRIYYVHGRVPSRFRLDISRELVATESSYHALRERELDWRNIVQLQLLTTSRALFIGLSLSDPNLRWLLKNSHQASHRMHYSVQIMESHVEIQNRLRQISGVNCDLETATALSERRKHAHEQLGKYLGVDFLRISDWGQLPILIDAIFGEGTC